MNKSFKHHQMTGTAPRRQRGIILVFGLILLLIMTIISITAIRGSGMEERMTGNVQDNNIAFQAAEAGLRAGEQDLQALTFDPLAAPPENNGYYTALASSLRWQTISWTSSSAVRSYTGFTSAPTGLTGASSSYYIERLSTKQQLARDESIVLANGANKLQNVVYFRITARGVGISGNSVVYLESIYKAVI